MKCPLRYKIEKHAATFVEFEFPDCPKEECAWWYKRARKCGVLGMASQLPKIKLELKNIAKKMPHLEQFKRA